MRECILWAACVALLGCTGTVQPVAVPPVAAEVATVEQQLVRWLEALKAGEPGDPAVLADDFVLVQGGERFSAVETLEANGDRTLYGVGLGRLILTKAWSMYDGHASAKRINGDARFSLYSDPQITLASHPPPPAEPFQAPSGQTGASLHVNLLTMRFRGEAESRRQHPAQELPA